MDAIVSMAALVAALAVGVISPGPSFIMVARTAVAQSRSAGLMAALGMGLGGTLFATLALLGLHAVLAAMPALYMALKILGGGYLVYLGFRIWRGADQPLPIATPSSEEAAVQARASRRRALAAGFLTQVSNPKTSLVYASVFAALLPQKTSLAFNLALPFVVFCVEAGWYAAVAWGLSAEAPRAAYLRFKGRIDRLAGGVLALLGLRLFASARVL